MTVLTWQAIKSSTLWCFFLYFAIQGILNGLAATFGAFVLQIIMADWLQPIEFIAGGEVAGAPVKKITDTAGGLFAGGGGPKPPPALSSAVLGMRTGGKVWDPTLPLRMTAAS